MSYQSTTGSSSNNSNSSVSVDVFSSSFHKVDEYDTQPELSFRWRSTHAVNYTIGAVTFVLGSICYYDRYQRLDFDGYTIGAWLYSLGSFTFLLADIQEWGLYREGCFGGKSHHHHDGEDDRLINTTTVGESDNEKVKLGVNFFLSAFGSFLYLVGSLGFVPAFQVPLIGDWGFIIGSFFIVVSQAWKVYRIGTIDERDPSSTTFKFSNWRLDSWTAWGVDFNAGVGGAFFFVATILYLPIFLDAGVVSLTSIINMWLMGSCFFLLSALCLVYRHMVLEL